MWWPFRKKKPEPEPGSIVQEHWETDFSDRKKIPLGEEEENGYRTSLTEDGAALSLNRKNLFAWTLFQPYRYRNFVFSMEISASLENAHAAAGAVFRYADEGTYYFVMVSPRGMFRFDVVFNGTPRTLIPWTACEESGGNSFSLTICAHGTFFAFFINGVWVGEVDDDTIDAGFSGIAGQNYHEKDVARFVFHRLEMESEDLAVETFYDEKVKGEGIPWENRRNLARRFFDMGQYSAALIQLRKSYRSRKPETEDFLFEARIYNFLHLEEDALRTIENCFPRERENKDVVMEKAGILYRMNRFLVLKEFLHESAQVWEGEPLLWNLQGNVEDALGNFESSYRCYSKASVLDTENGMYLLNAARACEKMNNTDEAVTLLKRAASIFFAEEDFETLQYVLSSLNRLAPDDPVGTSLKGKLLFQEGKTDEAFFLFKELREKGESDSSVDFLYALILADRGERKKADTIFSEVVKQEPDYYLYWFRYAENLYFLGKDTSGALEKALALNDHDPWVQNLAGLIALDADNAAEALPFFKHAFDYDPSLPEIRINYAEALMRTGKENEAFALLDDDENADIINERGNLFVMAGRFEEASRAYAEAQQRDPENRVFRENYADILIKRDRLPEAERILAALLESKAEAPLLVKIAFIAERKGEFRRAEMAYQEALSLEPESDSVKVSYADFLVSRHDFIKAQELLDRISRSCTDRRIDTLKNEIRTATMDKYECSVCHREWWVPKIVPEVGTLKLFGEPRPESPAGKCPSCGRVYCVSCAMNSLQDNRFTCSECGVPLKLSENYLRYLAAEFAKNA